MTYVTLCTCIIFPYFFVEPGKMDARLKNNKSGPWDPKKNICLFFTSFAISGDVLKTSFAISTCVVAAGILIE